MIAYQCDRCGKFFGRLRVNANELFVTDTRASIACNRIKDLCDDCQNELEEWWMKGKDKEVSDGDSD